MRLVDAAKSITRNIQNMAVNIHVGKQVLNLEKKVIDSINAAP